MNLRDPSKASHEIVEVLEDGDAIRNDGVQLQAANKNPWYVLATIYGEQMDISSVSIVDQNRDAWNAWSNRVIAGELKTKLTDLLRKRSSDSTATLPSKNLQIDFSNTYFPNGLDCSGFEFRNCVLFGDSIFNGNATFIDAKFKCGADFEGVTFGREATFNFAEFGSPSIKGADFINARFERGAFFHDTVFNEDANFQSAEFGAEAVFDFSWFKSATKFTGARFLTHVPEFHGAELFEKALFPTNANDDGNWPPRDVGKNKPKDQMPVEEQALAYNRLQKFMIKNMRIDGEQFFHRMEMRCKGKIDGGAYGLMHEMFDAVSEYGNNVFRPVGWLFVVWLSGAIAKLQAVQGCLLPDYHSIPNAMGWSFANLFPLFGFRGLYLEDQSCLHYLLQVTGGVQTVAGLVLLFLLGLGLRNRFRLR